MNFELLGILKHGLSKQDKVLCVNVNIICMHITSMFYGILSNKNFHSHEKTRKLHKELLNWMFYLYFSGCHPYLLTNYDNPYLRNLMHSAIVVMHDFTISPLTTMKYEIARQNKHQILLYLYVFVMKLRVFDIIHILTKVKLLLLKKNFAL